MSLNEELVQATNDSFWEIGKYSRTVKRIDNGKALCDSLRQLIQQRSEIETSYAKNLSSWSKKWNEFLDKGNEYGTIQGGWRGMLQEADSLADLHNLVADNLMTKDYPSIKAWQKENYHKSMMHFKETKELEEGFKKAQKPWEKKYTKLMQAKKEYHAACRSEKSTANQENNARGDSAVSPDQLKKIQEKLKKCQADVEATRDKYEASLNDLNSYNAKYIEDMNEVFQKCQDFEKSRIEFFKKTMFEIHQHLDLSVEPRFSQVYTSLHSTIGQIDSDKDLRWWSTNHGSDMPMNWPTFEEYSPELQNISKKKDSGIGGGSDGITITSIRHKPDGFDQQQSSPLNTHRQTSNNESQRSSSGSIQQQQQQQQQQQSSTLSRTKMSGNISPQIPSVEAEEPKEVAKIIEDDHSKGVPENDLEKVEDVEESKEDSCEGVVTTDMLKEEENLENEGKKEEGKFKEEQQKIWDQLDNADRELRYNKLQLLLNKSTVYTQYLIKRMERQKQEDQKRRERLAKKMAKKTQAETSDQKNSTDERRSHRTKTSMYSSPSSSQEKKIGKGRKRKEGMESSDAKPTTKRKKRDPDPQNLTASEGDNVSQESDQINSSTTTQHTKSIADGLSKEEQANSDTEEMLIEETEKKALLEKNDEHPVLFTGGSLRQYQKEGYKWLRTSYENGVNGILADEMGLGKTVQCIAMLAHLIYQGVTGPFLVVAPLSTLPNWYSEFRRFTPKVPVILYHGTPDERTRLRIQIRKTTPIREGVNVHPVVITSYEITMRDRTSLQSHDWKILIVDEGHRIKNTHCRLIRELRMYGNTHRLLLTGTPLQNNLAELWSLLNFLLPEIFDDLGSFEMWFDVERLSLENAEEKIVKEEQQKNILSMLHQILTPFMLRRLKQDVELKLPPKKELLVYAPMSSLQQEYYTSTVDKTILDKIQEKSKEPEFIEYDSNGRPVRQSRKKTVNYSLLDEKDDGCSDSDLEEDLEKWFNVVQDSSASYTAKEKVPAKSVVTIRMQNIMMQLRKCCNHPYLLEYPLTESGDYKIDEDLVQTCGKMKLLDAMLAELKLRKHKVLIFSQMTKMLDILQDFCWLRKYKFCRLDGSTSIQERQEQMADFNSNPEAFIFLLSTRAGGLGINLVGADTVIIYDSDWNPQCDLQAQDRCHRIGQSKPVVIYRLVTTNTIDQRIVERAAAKRKLEKMVIHKGRFKSGMENFSDKFKPLSPQELMELLKAKDHENEVKDVDNLSKEALDSLLDRSDLYAKWKDQEEADKSQRTKGKKPKKQQKTSVFSVIDEEI